MPFKKAPKSKIKANIMNDFSSSFTPFSALLLIKHMVTINKSTRHVGLNLLCDKLTTCQACIPPDKR